MTDFDFLDSLTALRADLDSEDKAGWGADFWNKFSFPSHPSLTAMCVKSWIRFLGWRLI